MVRIRIVDAFGSVDGGASCAAWSIAIALNHDRGHQHAWCDRISSQPRFDVVQTLDFLLRQAIHAVLTHRRLAEALGSLSLSLSFRRDLGLVEGDRGSTELSMGRMSGLLSVGDGSCGRSASSMGEDPTFLGDASKGCVISCGQAQGREANTRVRGRLRTTSDSDYLSAVAPVQCASFGFGTWDDTGEIGHWTEPWALRPGWVAIACMLAPAAAGPRFDCRLQLLLAGGATRIHGRFKHHDRNYLRTAMHEVLLISLLSMDTAPDLLTMCKIPRFPTSSCKGVSSSPTSAQLSYEASNNNWGDNCIIRGSEGRHGGLSRS